jgi:transposase-like protein
VIADASGMASSADSGWRAARREVVAAIRSGEISRADAARELGVSASTVRDWERAERTSADHRFVAVEIGDRREAPRAVAALEVALVGGRVLRVASGFDAGEVVRLVRALESC